MLLGVKMSLTKQSMSVGYKRNDDYAPTSIDYCYRVTCDVPRGGLVIGKFGTIRTNGRSIPNPNRLVVGAFFFKLMALIKQSSVASSAASEVAESPTDFLSFFLYSKSNIHVCLCV